MKSKAFKTHGKLSNELRLDPPSSLASPADTGVVIGTVVKLAHTSGTLSANCELNIRGASTDTIAFFRIKMQ